MSRLLIKSGTLITASETFTADLLIEEEKITAIGHTLDAPGAEIVDAPASLYSRRR